MATESECRDYLLGRMSEADAERFESTLLEDDEVFRAVREVEDDLFDAFARDRLTDDERTRFLQRFGAEANRLEFARALAQRVPHDRSSGGSRTWWSTWMPLAAAALLVLVVGLAWLTSRRGTAPAAVVAGAPSAAIVPPVIATLTLATTRAAGDVTSIQVPAAAPALQLRVRLNPADKYDRYAFELRSSSNRVVWRGDDLRASVEAGDLMVVATLPAASLEAGTYELAVRGGTEDLGFVPVRIMRTP